MSKAQELIRDIDEVFNGVNEFKMPSFKKIKAMLKKFKKSKFKKPKSSFDAKAARKKQGKAFWRKFFESINEGVDDDKLEAFAKYMKVDPDDVDTKYGFSVDGEDWEVLTDKEADEALKDYISESVWAFNTDFLASYIDAEDVIKHLDLNTTYYDDDADDEVELDDKEEIVYINTGMNLRELIESYQAKYESGNQDLINMIGDFDGFVSDAESADGRGHFLSGYDGEEVEMGDFYGYRVN